MRLAAKFYAIHRAEGAGEIVAYHPDTQSVFDVAHLLNGAEIFYEIHDEPDWVHELMESVWTSICASPAISRR